MAQRKISARDRAIIKSRLARGFSYSDCLKGTRVASKGSVQRIAHEEADDIERWKLEFMAMVSGFGGDPETQARQLAKAVTAKKPYGKAAVMHEDWKSQLETIKYLHKLQGVAPEEGGGTTVNILNNPAFIRKYDERQK